MAKKRRDKKRDPSTLQKLSKVGTTALAAGAGAVFLGRRPGINKFLTETASPLIRNTQGFKKDLIGKNKKNLMTYYNAYKKNYKGTLSTKNKQIRELKKEINNK